MGIIAGVIGGAVVSDVVVAAIGLETLGFIGGFAVSRIVGGIAGFIASGVSCALPSKP